MELLQVAKVELLNNGQIAIYPVVAEDGYQYIYRAGAGVEWVSTQSRFLSPSRESVGAPFPLTPEQRFTNLARAAISELGIHPRVSASTEWVAVPQEVRRAIEAAYSA